MYEYTMWTLKSSTFYLKGDKDNNNNTDDSYLKHTFILIKVLSKDDYTFEGRKYWEI